MARPTKYKAEYAEQALKLCRLGATDVELANFFAHDRSEEEFLAYWLLIHRQDRNGAIAFRKGRRASRRADRSTPSARLLNATRARIWAALKGRSDGRLFSRLGYSIEDLVSHLETKFLPGMSWENYGDWHVDHIKPCAKFDQLDANQFSACWALGNLQPLWAEDNIKKGASYGGS